MKNILQISSLLIALLLLSSCDDRDAVFDGFKKSKFVFLSPDGEVKIMVDSIKISLKSQRKVSSFRILVEDENIDNVSFSFALGGGTLKQNGVALVRTLDLSKSVIDLEFTPESIGTHVLIFRATDRSGEVSDITVTFTSFLNVPPVADFSLTKLAVLSNLEYEIDASSSYDGDEKFGGGIVLYRYTINGQVMDSHENKIKWIFGSSGLYTIKVEAQDADEAWASKEETIYVN